MPFEPLNTFAVVVAIEQYETLGPDWNRIRTIAEGIRFVRWLCEEEKLPPANIRFFAGERDGDSRQSLDELRRDHQVSHEAAKADEIRSSLTDWLCRRLDGAPAGDCAFYFYWSGHGVSDSRVHHGLVCSEMKAGTDPRVFSLDAIRATLRQEGWKRLRRQAFFVDACASPSPRQLLPVDLPDDPGLIARRTPMQFAACSAPPQRTVSNAGRFSSILLEALRTARREEGMPDMDYAAALLWHRYRRLRNDGQLQTDPWPHLDLLGWNDASFPLATIEDDGEDARLRRWKREAINLLAKPGLATPYEHYLGCKGSGQDQWLDPHDDYDSTLGANYRVALRWIERASGDAGPPAERWKELTGAIFRGTGAAIDWTEKEHGKGKFRFLEMMERLAFFTGFSFHPFNGADGPPDGLLDKALNQGMPFALWIRESSGAWAGVSARIEAAVAARDRHRTPADLRRYRGANHSCGLGVLWDDPARNPFHFDPKTGRAFEGGRVMFTDVAGTR